MSPILGIWASGRQPALNGSSYESIQTVTVGSGGQSSVTFSSIPSTYTHLQIRFSAITNDTGAGGVDNISATLNSDTTYTNYRSHYLNGNGSSVASGSIQVSSFNAYVADVANNLSSNTTIVGVCILDILDYANTNKNKTLRSINGADRNGSGSINVLSSLWLNTSAISNILLKPVSGTLFNQYSSFALYGIKG